MTGDGAAPAGVLAVVALGSNLGDRLGYLRDARRALASLRGAAAPVASAVYETAPVGGPPQGPYLNAAVALRTTLDPHELLSALQAVEAAAARAREVRDGPRTLDLDLVLYGDRESDDPALTLPHPRFALRAFALLPAADVAAGVVVPRTGGRTVRELLAAVRADAAAARRVAGADDWA